ncbi:MAG: hypothetical protein AVO35_08490 [Candidatus Aegiribacteria sp. MLS_C]|nr:MAG: hypothetical protein AVO35_08490 [Candidatus Aegiribacteria sp. MLS_C]
MVIAVASGKGGTGKTTVAVSLALAASNDADARPLLLDCDVEEPNCALFLDLDRITRKPTGVLVPEVDPVKCDLCGRCAEVCVWKAIAVAGEKVLVFRDLCHGCGSCTLMCPRGAIHEIMHETGSIEESSNRSVDYAGGVLNVGQVMAVPVISALLDGHLRDRGKRTVILDSSPGSSCPMVETVKASDYVILVTEPTPFGLHDLDAAVRVVTDQLHIPSGVIVNRDGTGNDDVIDFCRERGLPVLARIPMDRRIAEVLSEGKPLVRALPEYMDLFREILATIGETTS